MRATRFFLRHTRLAAVLTADLASVLTGVLAVAALVLVAVVTPSAAEWEDDLQLQMATGENCEAVSISNLVERKKGGHMALSALVECADGRKFVAFRDRPLKKFDLRACTTDEDCDTRKPHD